MPDESIPIGAPKKVSLWNSCRLVFSICAFFGFFFHLCVRLNLTFTLRCMIKRPKNTSFLQSSDSSCPANTEQTRTLVLPTEFDWSKANEGLLISSYFYGYVVGQPTGGLLCGFCKAKVLFITSLLLQSICTLMFPPIARKDFHGVVVIRIIQGFFGGLLIPSVYQMYTSWAHPSERATLMAFAYSGFPVGSVLIFPLTSFFCQLFYDNGWPFSFYTIGGLCFVFSISLNWLIYEDITSHKRISSEEYSYLQFERKDKIKPKKIPVLKIITSIPIITFAVVHFCQSFGVAVLTLCLPQYLEETLHVNIKWNGLYSAAPFIGSLISRLLLSFTYNRIYKRTNVSLTVYRKIFHLFGSVSASVIIFSITFLNCKHSTLIVTLLGFLGAVQDLCFIGSYWTSYLELAPAFAGVLSGFTNTLSTLSGIITPNIVPKLVTEGKKEEWNRVLYIIMGLYAFSAFVYTVFGSSEPLPWGQFSDRVEQKTKESEKI